MFFEFLSQILLCPKGIIVVDVRGEEFQLAFRTRSHSRNFVYVSQDGEGSFRHSTIGQAIISSQQRIGKRP